MDEERADILRQRAGKNEDAVVTSALTGEGADAILSLIEAKLSAERKTYIVTVAPSNGAGYSWLYREGEVLRRTDLEDGSSEFIVRLPDSRLMEAEHRFDLELREQKETGSTSHLAAE